jgi:hypothetical protein
VILDDYCIEARSYGLERGPKKKRVRHLIHAFRGIGPESFILKVGTSTVPPASRGNIKWFYDISCQGGTNDDIGTSPCSETINFFFFQKQKGQVLSSLSFT